MFYIIVNPNAGRGAATKYAALLEEGLRAAGIAHTSVLTTGVLDGYNKAREFCKEGDVRGIIGVGGDGTMQEIAAALADSFPRGQKIPIPLCIYPAGSGNDFVMSLVPKRGSRKKDFIQKLTERDAKTVDIISAGSATYLNIGNMGLDAWIVKNAMDLKGRYGSRAYLAAVYKSIFSYRPISLRIETNNKSIEDRFTLVAVCNGQYYGGGLQISPMAKTDDGKITLCLVREMTRLKTMLIFPSLMLKKHMYLKAVEFLECSELKITLLDETGVLCLDGNLYPASGELEFKIYEKALDVIV